jgi:hypothetical protein
MPLVEVELPVDSAAVPPEVRAFLGEADRRIEQFQATSSTPGFVPSDYVGAFGVLRSIVAANVAAGSLFCEWGSGFGVVAGLAAMLEFDAYGIEIDEALVAGARELAADFDLQVEFARDSFIPSGGEDCADVPLTFAWLTAESGRAEEELGLAVDDFDIIFAYPWPDEEHVIYDLFHRYAGVGSLLVTSHGGEGFRIRRKTAARAGRKKRGHSANNGNGRRRG